MSDGAWRNTRTGEIALRAAAEALKMNIDLIDGDKLERELEKFGNEELSTDKDNPNREKLSEYKVETLRFRPTPILASGEAEPVESRFGPEKAATVFLWKDHYYPLVPKGIFPNLRRISNHYVELQVSSPPLSSSSETRINGREGANKIEKILQKVTMHQADISESLGTAKHDLTPVTSRIRPYEKNWSPEHYNSVLQKEKSQSHLEDLPSQPFKSGPGTVVDRPVEQKGINGWAAFGLGAGLATTVAAGLISAWRWLARRPTPRRNERVARDINYYSDDEFDVNGKL